VSTLLLPSYDVLIASDAIGMGLNLNIGRLIFSTLSKYDGKDMRPLTTSEIKQIAGRAGRFGSVFSQGFVTT
jgi:ATP-dependent RNA helicase SUPV3L1/SUV3